METIGVSESGLTLQIKLPWLGAVALMEGVTGTSFVLLPLGSRARGVGFRVAQKGALL